VQSSNRNLEFGGAQTKKGRHVDDISSTGGTERFDGSMGPRIIGPAGGKSFDFGMLGVRFMIWSKETGGQFSLVEHPIPPRTLAAPLHRHAHEDEYSYVLEGRLGAKLGDDVVYAEAGDLVFKPRNQWLTFWNDGDSLCRILEIIAPGGFEGMFDEMGSMTGPPTLDELRALGHKYGIDEDFESIGRLCQEFGLAFPM
jgi:quercetin dioxygenase-like cupin family protein